MSLEPTHDAALAVVVQCEGPPEPKADGRDIGLRGTQPTCECGCGQPTQINTRTDRAKGWRKGEPRRFVKGHAARKTGPLFAVDPNTGCWEWTGRRDADGYGRWSRDSTSTRLAHRIVYEQHRDPIPAGLQLDHLCRNHGCVNPDHLEPVTNAENTRRGERTRLSAADVDVIRTSGETHAAVAQRFGITAQYAGQLRAGKWWVAA